MSEEEHNEKIARFLSVTDSEDGETAKQMVPSLITFVLY
jgi:hypothetical protein